MTTIDNKVKGVIKDIHQVSLLFTDIEDKLIPEERVACRVAFYREKNRIWFSYVHDAKNMDQAQFVQALKDCKTELYEKMPLYVCKILDAYQIKEEEP